MSSSFKVVGILGKTQDIQSVKILRQLIAFLQQQHQAVILETRTAAALHDHTLPVFEKDELGKHCQLLIVVGGDGTLLHAAHAIIQDEVPILGVNRGRLGFLTDLNPDTLEALQAILEGKYHIEKRFFLEAKVELQGSLIGSDVALNEVALIPDALPHMTEFEIYVDDHFVCSQDSDGLIIATPTGSTAYALSGGGPILHPELNAVTLIPMFPHTLTMRPIVIAGDHRITIVITPNNTTSPRITCDSKTLIPTPPHARIHICKKKEQLHLIHPLDYDYYESLRSKLYWGRKISSRAENVYK